MEDLDLVKLIPKILEESKTKAKQIVNMDKKNLFFKK